MSASAERSDDWLIVLAKQPLRGHAKTRLARDIGADAAHSLAQAFVLDTLALALRLPGVRVLIAFTPTEARGWFEERAAGAELIAQPEGEFGVRVHSATREAFARGAARCVMIGTDTPHLEARVLEAAFEALRTADVCLGPSFDGGYYLIGLRADQPRLFTDIPWSTDAVHATTLERASEARLSVAELPLELDIDEGSDLEGLAAVLRERRTEAPRTRAALAHIERSRP